MYFKVRQTVRNVRNARQFISPTLKKQQYSYFTTLTNSKISSIKTKFRGFGENETVSLQLDGQVAYLTLNNPKRKNALSGKMMAGEKISGNSFSVKFFQSWEIVLINWKNLLELV